MTVDLFLQSNHFANLKRKQAIVLYLLEQLEEKGIQFLVHTTASKYRFVLVANEALDRQRNRDFLTIITRRNGLLIWPKYYGVSWNSEEGMNLQKLVYHQDQMDEEFIESVIKAYVSICKKQ